MHQAGVARVQWKQLQPIRQGLHPATAKLRKPWTACARSALVRRRLRESLVPAQGRNLESWPPFLTLCMAAGSKAIFSRRLRKEWLSSTACAQSEGNRTDSATECDNGPMPWNE